MPYKTSLLRAFYDHLKKKGSDLIIYKNWNTPQISSFSARAIKTNKTLFQFPLETNIEKGDLIQIIGDDHFWSVIEVITETYLKTDTNLNVTVEIIS